VCSRGNLCSFSGCVSFSRDGIHELHHGILRSDSLAEHLEMAPKACIVALGGLAQGAAAISGFQVPKHVLRIFRPASKMDFKDSGTVS
jgi:hypothetical protein